MLVTKTEINKPFLVAQGSRFYGAVGYNPFKISMISLKSEDDQSNASFVVDYHWHLNWSNFSLTEYPKHDYSSINGTVRVNFEFENNKEKPTKNHLYDMIKGASKEVTTELNSEIHLSVDRDVQPRDVPVIELDGQLDSMLDNILAKTYNGI